jgi:hypothetical protein
MARRREDLSEILLDRLTRPAADLIADRLAEAKEYEEVVTAASRRFLDALKAEEMARQFEYAEQVSARKAVVVAAAELKVALGLRTDIRDLVGVATRGIADHLALEGIFLEEREAGDIVVELLVPRPDPKKADRGAIPQEKLRTAAREILKAVPKGKGEK